MVRCVLAGGWREVNDRRVMGDVTNVWSFRRPRRRKRLPRISLNL
jgi:hypothetical protein